MKHIQKLPVNKFLASSQLSTKLVLLLLLMRDKRISTIHMSKKSRIAFWTSNGCYLFLEVFEKDDHLDINVVMFLTRNTIAMKNYAYSNVYKSDIGVKDESLFIIMRKFHSKAGKDTISHWESASTV